MPLPLNPRMLLAGLALAAPAAAQAHCHTRWDLVNTTNQAVYLECLVVRTGLRMSTAKPIPPHGRAVHCWGCNHYSDGLGLQAGVWTAAAGPRPHPLGDAGEGETSTFRTEWGEMVTLTVVERNGRPVLTKATTAEVPR